MSETATLPKIDEIIDQFSVLDDWDDRYSYLIELGRMLAPLSVEKHNELNKVRGCASQVWLDTQIAQGHGGPMLWLTGDSDAHIVRGLVALAIAIFSGHSAHEILGTDASQVFAQLGLAQHLTPQRSNGVKAMVERIKAQARAALAA